MMPSSGGSGLVGFRASRAGPRLKSYSSGTAALLLKGFVYGTRLGYHDYERTKTYSSVFLNRTAVEFPRFELASLSSPENDLRATHRPSQLGARDGRGGGKRQKTPSRVV